MREVSDAGDVGQGAAGAQVRLEDKAGVRKIKPAAKTGEIPIDEIKEAVAKVSLADLRGRGRACPKGSKKAKK